jgi:hypothetical protein
MGMFDYLYISASLLPVSDEEKKMIGNDVEWQTKDFDRYLTEIYITDDGELKICRWELENVPKEERPYPNDEGILGILGSVRRINERLETLNYHGIVNFYSTINREWYEFSAKFTDGKLVSIEREIPENCA